MEIEYDLTVEDLTAFVRFHAKHGPRLKPHPLVRVISWGFVVAGVVLPTLFGLFSLQSWGGWLSGFCLGILAGFLIVVLVVGGMKWKVIIWNTIQLYERDECRWYFAQRRLKITTDGFEIANEFQHLRYGWYVVWQIESTANHVFFYTIMNQAHIIPRRAFRNDQQFEDFIDLACRYHQGQGRREAKSEPILDALPARPTGITRPPKD